MLAIANFMVSISPSLIVTSLTPSKWNFFSSQLSRARPPSAMDGVDLLPKVAKGAPTAIRRERGQEGAD